LDVFLAVFTYLAYIFIIVMYAIKTVKYIRMPTHLRWDLYPVAYEERYSYAGSYFKLADRQKDIRGKRTLRRVLFLLKEYFTLSEYYKRDGNYWLFLYLWHIGFILIITFHIFCFIGAVSMLFGITISPDSSNIPGLFLYYSILFTGVPSFIAGAFGSTGLFVKRIINKDLSLYTSPLNYFSYTFILAVFLSGLYAWLFVDPVLSEYRAFWKGLITLNFINVKPSTTVHILLFNLFLIYLPFTRSMHYITRFFAFFLIRWDDKPNLRGSGLEKRLQKLFDQRITWSAPHIESGKTWKETIKQ
jgi:nitrate reductase gamma subunit